MRALSASELLDVWEQGLTHPPVQRALILLSAMCPDTSADALASLSIGQRDARLLTLREWTFGPEMVSLLTCPGCGERLEYTFNVTDIRVTFNAEPIDVLSLSCDGYEMAFRLPNSLDMGIIADQADAPSAWQILLERCIIKASHNSQETSVKELPQKILDAVVEQMAQADPQADVQLTLICPACSHKWEAAFDIVSFFWSEISTWAKRILREVHTLASVYKWREADILRMSPWRRQFYLDMIGK